MDNNLIEFERSDKLTDKQIFTEIWSSPRKVLKYINDFKYDKFVYLLLFVAGVVAALDKAVDDDYGDKFSIWGILGLSFLLGGLLGWLSYYIYAALISWTGKWLNGKGDTKSILRILAYAAIPSLLILLLTIIQILIYGKELFKADGDIIGAGTIGNIIFYSALFFEFVLVVFNLVFTIVGVSEVQKFSKSKAFLNILLPILILIVPILVILLIFKAF